VSRAGRGASPRVVVMGGGFTGCLTALRLATVGVRVHLIETQRQLGGVLRDEVAEGRHWLRGCQYADAEAPWCGLLSDEVASHLEEVPHSMGSLTVDEGETVLANDLAVPMLRGTLPLATTNAATGTLTNTLAERFAEYGDWAPRLSTLVERSGFRVAQLSDRAAMGLQMSRVAAADVSTEAVLMARSRSAWAEARLAVPRSARGLPMAGALVPRQGWSPFFDALHKQLLTLGVQVSLGQTVRVTAQPHHLTLTVPGFAEPSLQEAVVVWAGNPVPLYTAWKSQASVPGARLDNVAMRAVQVHADVTQWQGPVPHYVQWFAPDSPLLRVYVYRHGTRLQACLECVGPLDAEAVSRVAAEAANGCTSMGYGPSTGGLHFAPQSAVALRLHHLQSARDVARLEQLVQALTPGAGDDHNTETSPSRVGVNTGGIVPGGWLSYARDDKLRDIARGLDLHGLSPS